MRKAREEAAKQELQDRFDLRLCSMEELFISGIRPQLVVTDPPYPEKHLHLYGELARCCAAAKVPLMAAMCGQSYLPEILALMTPHLKYIWTMAYLTPGGQVVQMWDRKINTFWKPVLLFGDNAGWLGEQESGWSGDVIKSAVNDNDKDWHQWGQSTTGMVDLIKRLIGHADPAKLLVCDPFLGGGTTAVACMELGLKCVGCDINPKNVEKTRLRLGF